MIFSIVGLDFASLHFAFVSEDIVCANANLNNSKDRNWMQVFNVKTGERTSMFDARPVEKVSRIFYCELGQGTLVLYMMGVPLGRDFE